MADSDTIGRQWTGTSKTALSLSGRARDAARELDITALNSETGVIQLLEKSDGLYLKDENQRTYCLSTI